MPKINWKMAIRLSVAAGVFLLLLLARMEFGRLLLYRGMPGWQVEALMGRPEFVDILSDVPPEEGHGLFYQPGFFGPFLAVEVGPDGRVRDVHYFR